MRTFILVDHSHGAGIVHNYGTITATDEYEAAASIQSEIVGVSTSGTVYGKSRHTLKESIPGICHWFLEEVNTVNVRPPAMNRPK